MERHGCCLYSNVPGGTAYQVDGLEARQLSGSLGWRPSANMNPMTRFVHRLPTALDRRVGHCDQSFGWGLRWRAVESTNMGMARDSKRRQQIPCSSLGMSRISKRLTEMVSRSLQPIQLTAMGIPQQQALIARTPVWLDRGNHGKVQKVHLGFPCVRSRCIPWKMVFQ
jgi:hypothetical protein